MFRTTRARPAVKHLGFGLAVALFAGASVHGQRVPQTRTEVARPGGKLPGSPKVALVKVADGFNDPTNVASPNDGTRTIEVIYAGGTGAMQAFGNRLTQEEILKIMAFVGTLRK